MNMVVLPNDLYRAISEWIGDQACVVVTCEAYMDAIVKATGASRDEVEQSVENAGDLCEADTWVWFLRQGSPLITRIADCSGTDSTVLNVVLDAALDVIWPNAAG